MLGTMTVVALALSAVVPPSAAGAVPPPPSVSVEIAAVNGTGCPSKTAAAAMTKDNSAFTVTFRDFSARAGTGATPVEFRRNCQVNVRLKFPTTHTFGIARVEHFGSGKLQSGANAVLRGHHYFAGEPSSSPSSHTFNGPLNDKWSTSDTTKPDDVFYPPCGQSWNLNTNTELRVNKGGSTELSTMSMSSDVSATYHLSWWKCDD